MLRITVEHQVALVLLVLEGRIIGPWVEELRKVIASLAAEAREKGVVVALTSVSGVDAEGRELLAQLHAKGICLLGTGLKANLLIEEITQFQKHDGDILL